MMKLTLALAALLGVAAALPYHPLQHAAPIGRYNYAYHPLARFGFGLPQINLPLPQLSIPKPSGPAPPSDINLPGLSLPDISLPGISLPGLPGLPGVPQSSDIPAAALPDTSVGQVPASPLEGGAGGDSPVPPPAEQSGGQSWYVLLHEWVYTKYTTWSYAGHPSVSGLTWGLQCKGEGCSIKTGFVGYRNEAGAGYLALHGGSGNGAGSTEHSHDYGKVFCAKGQFMTSLNCKDRACTSMELVCAPLHGDLRPVYEKRWGGVWDSDYQRVFCREGEYMDGIECVGSCTKHFNIFCTKVEAVGSH